MTQTSTENAARTLTSVPLAIREATPDDAEALAALAERTFRDAFEGENDPEDMEAYVRDAFAEKTIRSELRQEVTIFLLAFAGGRRDPIGYVKLRRAVGHHCVTGPKPIELQRIYVDPAVIGRGLGAALMQACLDEARAAGHQTLWLGVWEHNERAIAFYEKWGFETVGEHSFTLGSDDQRDLVMQRAV